MKHPATLEPLPLSIDPSANAPLWSQVSTGIRVAIANGLLGAGARLPSTRVLSRQLRVSRNTVMAAYDDLIARGLVTGCTGAGSFVTVTARSSMPIQTWFSDAAGNRLSLAPLP